MCCLPKVLFRGRRWYGGGFSSVTQSRPTFGTPWTAASQASLSITTALSLLNSCPSSRCCHPMISSSIISFSCLQSFPASGSLQMSQFFWISWTKYWSLSFSISPSNEYSGLISFRIDWFDLCSSRDSQVSSSTPQCKSINSLVLSFLYGPTLTCIYDHWKKHSFDYTDICW